ncbi:23S rRNA (uracil(1939)-C(5))-methyltransferase RlmD [uncultured Thiothrix sp.]|uniref:23S rRNA (uracil(1939)-C(5))-methyltransferase RlmD n=1 Tax=uncultured Thiothrix sp. TaxID=223185 RepID=UPI0026373AEA|nr:23S rRNA (uracil(1939)-C(5))-methyltransferase RlmD [uncultured Thiothrix sp.]HMT93256.1 23S rRNA (uracil(1939)-C(5))-methyltransferase RlmD [Thiolinea sp.]
MSRRQHKPRGVQNSPLVEAEVTALTLEGKGVARVDGKTVFIDGALPEEKVAFRYTSYKANYDEGRVETVLSASPNRVEPKCQHFAICGGCSWQHISLEAQIIYKQQILLDNLQHIGKVQPETVFEPLTADGWAYRRKARLGARWVRKKQQALVGFREKTGGLIAEISRCEILHPLVGERITALQQLVTSMDAREMLPQIEVAIGDEEVAALVVRHMESLSAGDTEKLLNFAREFKFELYLQPAGPQTVHKVYGSGDLFYAHPPFNTRVQFAPLDFIQVNQALNRKMVIRALELLEVKSTDTVLDLFCGLGNFTLPLARQVAQVIGVEGDQAMVERARAAAHANQIQNTDYYACNLMAEDLSQEPWLKRSYDRILLDPPRAGAKELIPHLGKLKAERIVYVSCDPATLARDAGELVNTQGYKLMGAGVMDMFPHTAHVESIAVFVR